MHMIITNRNSYDISKISLHDAYFEDVIYNHSEKKITIKLESEWNNDNYILEFQNTLYYEMTCCEFWGGGYNVFCWNEIDTTQIFDKLLRLERVEKAESFSNDTQSHMDLHEYFGVELLINSGDRLKIICKSINVTAI